MNRIGLSSEEIVDLLTKENIENGQKADAEKLKAAIAKVVVENNQRLLTEIPKLVAQHMEREVAKMMRGLR